MYKYKASLMLLIITVCLLIAQQHNTAAQASKAKGMSSQYLPLISTPFDPPQLVMSLFVEDLPTDTISEITHAGDDRLFVVQREGLIRIVEPDGTLLATPFLDIRHLVTIQNWEQGLLGLAFHPNYPATPYFYLSYTEKVYNTVRIARFSVSASDANVADLASLQHLIAIPKTELLSLVHNSGDLNFGPDGYLYITVGDGGPDPVFGSGEVPDPANNGHRTDVLPGKILRIDVDNKPGNLASDCGGFNSYKVPADNPLADGPGGACDEIWASGLRNPWRLSFNPNNGDILFGDVGEWKWEEINYIPAGSPGGQNFGWHCWEGSYNHALHHPEIVPDCLPEEQYEQPIVKYNRDEGCSVVGGLVYRGQEYHRLRGLYLFGDFCSARLWTLYLDRDGNWIQTLAGNAGFNISTFGEGADGTIYAGEWVPFGPVSLYKVVAVP
jgi:glucose/arabinose dehydrogenase